MNESTLKKEVAKYTTMKTERLKVVEAWKAIDAQLDILRAEMKKMTKSANEQIATLKRDLQGTVTATKKPRAYIQKLRAKTQMTDTTLKAGSL